MSGGVPNFLKTEMDGRPASAEVFADVASQIDASGMCSLWRQASFC